MAWVFQRDGKWVIKWKDAAGRYRQRRTDCAPKVQAKTLARELSRKTEFQRVGLQAPDAPGRLTFGELLDWYWENFGAQLRSKGTRLSAERHLRPTLGERPLLDVTGALIDEVLCS